MASIDPLRNQMETALKAQSQAVATATATAMSAAHKAQASAELVESKTQYFLNDNNQTNDTSNGNISSSMHNVTNNQPSNVQLEIIETRIERRMERILEDKIELSMARLKSKLEDDFKNNNGQQQQQNNTTTNNNTNNENSNAIETAIIERINEVYERVIGLGGKLAEEAQRRGIVNNQLRAEIRQMHNNVEKAMEPDDSIEERITQAVAKAMVCLLYTSNAADE